MAFSIRLPGSTANLGPGYDVLGLALGIHNHVTVSDAAVDAHTITVRGLGARELPTDGSNLFFTSAETCASHIGKRLPPIDAQMEVNVPLARGLGSSSTAIVAGVVAANEVLGAPLARPELLDIATDIEGHPDNVSPCLYGGFTVSIACDGHVTCVRTDPPETLKAVVVVPEFQLKTKDARHALPDTVSHVDATFNVGRACVVTAAMMSGDLDALAQSMDDRLHQPQRAGLIPHYHEVTGAAKDAGALGVALSGAGPTLFAVTVGNPEAVGEAMTKVWARNNIGTTHHVLPFDLDGTVVA